MEIKYSKQAPTKNFPCLMKNKHGEVFLVTKGLDDDFYVTVLNCELKQVRTWKSDLEGYEIAEAGTKIELIS
jgi:hypothetical protein